MEKRNFVTSLRTADGSKVGDDLVDGAASLFGSKDGQTLTKKASEYEKKASEEDEKSDSLS